MATKHDEANDFLRLDRRQIRSNTTAARQNASRTKRPESSVQAEDLQVRRGGTAVYDKSQINPPGATASPVEGSFTNTSPQSSSAIKHEHLPTVVREIRNLADQVNRITEEQQKHTIKAQSLETEIQRGEMACGRMLRRVLELQREIENTQNAIEMRRNHISEDKIELERERAASDAKAANLRFVTARMNQLTNSLRDL